MTDVPNNGSKAVPEAVMIGAILIMPNGGLAVNLSPDVDDPTMVALQVINALSNGVIESRAQEKQADPRNRIIKPKPVILRP